MTVLDALTAADIAAKVNGRDVSARAVIDAALARIERDNPRLNCFTATLAERARHRADRVDAAIARKAGGLSLAGVPFGVKNLFDVEGLVTIAGSKIHRDSAPASTDATLVRHLEEAGAVLVGTQHMDEYAYGFTTENAHYGVTHNPHDVARMAGGSSGGSAAAVAAGMVPLSLGSDTNGSIRVPASFCGVFGLKPTFGRLSRAGTLGFVQSLDHLGPFARSARDLAQVYDALQGLDSADPSQARRAVVPCLPGLGLGVEGLRCGILGGWFQQGASGEVIDAVEQVAGALGAKHGLELPEAQRARAAAFCITAAEGANLHLPNLKTRAADFDPATRDRLLAGALLPATVVQQAQRFRRWFYEQTMTLFADHDILIAPATPVTAPQIGDTTMSLGGRDVPARPNIGLYTQPISFIGLPVVAVPVHRRGRMPAGVQIIAAPWREDLALRVAAWLEGAGIVTARVAGESV